MVSKQAWEDYKRVTEDLTKAGVEKESWGKRSSNKDLSETFLQTRLNKDVKLSDDIVGFSSSDDDDEQKPSSKSAVKNYLPKAKRALVGQESTSNKRKRQKKHDDVYKTPQFPQRIPRTSCHSKSNAMKWRIFSSDFENSFTTNSPSPRTSGHPDCSKDVERNDDEGGGITWSDSENEDGRILQTENAVATSQDKVPISLQCVEQEQHSGNIDEFDSDPESCTIGLLDKEISPNISSNTPTPTPTPCSPKEGEHQPLLDSSKKRKQKYLRSGLAERFHKLSMRESSKKSFWFHKIRQMNRDTDDDSAGSSTPQGTVTLQVMTQSLDRGVDVMKCHVVSQDVEPLLPRHVIILLESKTKKDLERCLTGAFLRIYSPWRSLYLPNYSEPILLCMAHYEVLSTSSLSPSHVLPEVEQAQNEVKRSTVSEKHPDAVRLGSNVEDDENLGLRKTEPDLEPIVDWDLQDGAGYEGLCVASRVNVTARIQRTYWRSVQARDQSLNSARSLTFSIIEHSKLPTMDKRMSFCCLIQSLKGVFCEVRFPENILLNRADWHEMLRQAEGEVLLFSKLRVLEHRKRQRRHKLFSLIDSLKKPRDPDESRGAQSLAKQQSCFVLVVDEQSLVKPLRREDKVSDYPCFTSPQSVTLDHLSSSTAVNGCRVKLYGKLLHVRFTRDKYYDTKHIRLWLSGIFLNQETEESDVMVEPALLLIQVQYSSGRTVEWNESTLLVGQLLSMQDLVLRNAKPTILTADVYSKIQVIRPQSSAAQYDTPPRDVHELWLRTVTESMTDEKYTWFKSLPAADLPNVGDESTPDTLVMFEGIVFGVDQENAFCWYACSHCGSENVFERQDCIPQYLCNSCNLEFNSPVTNTHLEVYLKSTDTSSINVKVKLLQKTIAELLSGSEEDDTEGYDVNCVLNKRLGPMYCYIVEKTGDVHAKMSFTLEELDSCSWTT